MKVFAAALSLIGCMTPAFASNISVSLAEIPGTVNKEAGGAASGNLPDLLALIDEYYLEGDFEYGVYPFGRSINNVTAGRADAHAPLINTGSGDAPDFQYVREPIAQVTFVIYSNKSNPVTADADFSTLNVETMIGHAHFFGFPVSESASIESALKKVETGRVDAYIMAQDAVDGLIRAEGFEAVHRAKYATWGSSLLVAQGPDGDALNETISGAIKAAKADPRYQGAAEQMHAPYSDWQP